MSCVRFCHHLVFVCLSVRSCGINYLKNLLLLNQWPISTKFGMIQPSELKYTYSPNKPPRPPPPPPPPQKKQKAKSQWDEIWTLCPFNERYNIRLATSSDKVYHGRWFSLGTLAYSTTKTGRHDIAEILLKVALSAINQSIINHIIYDADFVETYCVLQI